MEMCLKMRVIHLLFLQSSQLDFETPTRDEIRRDMGTDRSCGGLFRRRNTTINRPPFYDRFSNCQAAGHPFYPAVMGRKSKLHAGSRSRSSRAGQLGGYTVEPHC
jgi:hypothetical protein